MKLATIRTAGGTRAARVDGDGLVLLADADVGALLQRGSDWKSRAERADGDTVSLGDADFAQILLALGRHGVLRFPARTKQSKHCRSAPGHQGR